MAEISIVKQLTGPEALDSMLHELRQKLRMNGRFQSHMAYPGYHAEISVRFYPAMSSIPPIEQDLEIQFIPVDETSKNNPKDVIISKAAAVEESVTIPIRPPNQVREDADMPTPILTQDANGNPVEKWVNNKGKVPKNKVKGGEGKAPTVTMVPTAIPVP